jgi:putative ABC transport system substrate-binding protein
VNRRRILAALAALAAVPLGALAQKPRAMARVGMLILASLPSVQKIVDGLRASLRELGYVEGRNISFEILSAEGNAERLPELAAQLVARKVDLIITGGGNVSTLAARKATATIPIVMTSSIGAVEAGLVQSLARPGGNVTGLSVPRELAFKQLELLRELVPSLGRILILVRHDPAMSAIRQEAKAFAQQTLLLALDYVEVRSPEELARGLEAARASKPDAMIVAPDPLLYQQREQILRFARAARIPDMHTTADEVEAGGLISYGPSAAEVYRSLTRIVDRILKGAKPAELPVEQPSKLDLVVNLRTAKALGLAIPRPILLRADQVIE